MTTRPPVIAVDGPSGSGKGSLGRRLSEVLGFHLLDSGALYRLVALSAIRRGVGLDQADVLAALARNLDVRFEVSDGDPPVRSVLEGRGVDQELRTEQCGDAASRVAAVPAVREALLQRQRDFRRLPGLVADGRDMGTVVFPDAILKLFLTARPEARAHRRHKQLIEKGISASLTDLLGDIRERDRRDSERSVAPLKPAPDAIVLDTTEVSLEEVYVQAMAFIRERLPAAAQAGKA